MFQNFIKFLLAFICLYQTTFAKSPLITTALGQITGLQVSSNVEAYLGIPYAAPPIGNLRWKATRPPTPWNGTLIADKFKPACPQHGNFFANVPSSKFGKPVGNEDCLYLNIWKPSNSTEKLPVVFWIHGGSNFKGTTSDPMYNGTYLASHSNVVMVSINYRLGLLGAFSHEAIETDDKFDSSGNYVTLDLVQGLKWVRENISNFGGDPDNVIIMGQSAGCMNVWGLLQTPISEGLFHKAVCSSGLPNMYPKAIARTRSNDFIENLVVNAGLVKEKEEAKNFISEKDKQWIHDFLYSRTTEELVMAQDYTVPFQHIEDNAVFPRGLDGTTLGLFHHVPMIIGSTRDEGTYLAGSKHFKVDQPTLWSYLQNTPPNLKFEDLIDVSYSKYKAETTAVSLSFNQSVSNAYLTARTYHPETYNYIFNWNEAPEPWKKIYGVVHCMDMFFFLGNFDTTNENFARFAWNDENKESRLALREKVNKHFTQFFWTGNPGWFGTMEFK